MSSEQTPILHADVDAFFASVEQRDDPRLRGKPVLVGGGVVMAASYEARAFGVHGGMGGARARRLCPQAIVVSPRFEAYTEASKAVFAVFREAAPRVEGLSLEEAFLDVRALERICGPPREIAARLRRDVRRHAGLTITVGVARTKLLAKMASGVAKPDGLLVVSPAEELAFLHPLAVERVWGVGRATARRLHELGVTTVGELAELGEAELVAILGRATGRHLHAIAHNSDRRPVRAGRRRRSFGAQSALGRSPRSAGEIDRVLVGLVERVTRRMRRARRVGRGITLRLRFDDFSRASRSHTLREATAATEAVLFVVRTLLAVAQPMISRRGLTLIGITVSGLERESGQLALSVDRPDWRALDRVLDELLERFGPQAVVRASAISGR